MPLVSPAQPPRSRRLAQLLQIVKQQQEAELAGQAVEQPAVEQPAAEQPAAEQPAAEAPVADSAVAGEVPKPKAYKPPRKDNGIGGRVAQVCASETVPIIACVGRDESEFDGYEHALFIRVAAEIGWGRGDYTFKCLDDWDTMLAHLSNNSGFCDIGLGGVQISQDNVYQGIQLTSIATIRTGFRILVGVEVYRLSFFVFLDAFNWRLWLAIILTCVFVGVAVWLLDPWARSQHVPSREDYRFLGLRQRVWSALANSMSFSATDMGESHAAGNVIVLAFAFMMLVLVSLYTAVTSSNLTANRLTSSVTGIHDLPGKKIATWDDEAYLAILARRGVNATGLPWNDEADQNAMFESVANGTFDALVLEDYILEYGSNSRCDVTVVGTTFNEYESGIAFSANFSYPEVIKRVNAALLRLKESGDMEELFAKYVNPPAPFCKRTAAAGQGTQIGFRDVVGLWVLLAGGVVAAILIIIAARVANHGARRARPAIERAVTLVRRRSSRSAAFNLGELESGGGGKGADSGGGTVAGNQNGKACASPPQQQLDAYPDASAEPCALKRRARRACSPGPNGSDEGAAAAAGDDAVAAPGAAGHAQLDALELEVLSTLQRYRRAAAAGVPRPPSAGVPLAAESARHKE